ncbi:hypothetical protein GCM10023194_38670 [Planotetraspora phitsanulokensis]|uniref:Uncharacterized protein n=1 Tax=Planotetraspora phitsanulokensis TaxID=575192 RepID=A0A8J3UAA5_9ACTN|nr:hypothetical protein Pph01_61730 [Planotetraspora phitsanulokensis]
MNTAARTAGADRRTQAPALSKAATTPTIAVRAGASGSIGKITHVPRATMHTPASTARMEEEKLLPAAGEDDAESSSSGVTT